MNDVNVSTNPKWRTCEVTFQSPITIQVDCLPHVGMLCYDWPSLLNSFGEPNWSVRDPLSAVRSSCQYAVCVWYSERRRSCNSKLVVYFITADIFKEKRKLGCSPKDICSWTYGEFESYHWI